MTSKNVDDLTNAYNEQICSIYKYMIKTICPSRCVEDLKSLKDFQDDQSFFSDGIVGDPRAFYEANIRILFLLKESGTIGFCDITRGVDGNNQPLSSESPGGYKNFWERLSKLKRIAEDFLLRGGHATGDKTITTDNCNALTPIAYVNLIKEVEAQKSTDKKRLKHKSQPIWALLKRQIDLINPHVIFCCGRHVFDIYRNMYWQNEGVNSAELYSKNPYKKNDYNLWKTACTKYSSFWKGTDYGIVYHSTENRLVISFYHPSYFRVKTIDLYNFLNAILNNSNAISIIKKATFHKVKDSLLWRV